MSSEKSAAASGEAVHFVKSMIHPSGWHECSAYEAEGHAKAGHVTRTLYTRPAATSNEAAIDPFEAVYCELRGCESHGLAACDDFKDWKASLAAPPAPTGEAVQPDAASGKVRATVEDAGGFCVECKGTGMKDSGGTYPWGEPALIPCGCDSPTTNADIHQQSAAPESFTSWLAREMPAGTVIGDPAWWAPKIARAYANLSPSATPALLGLTDAEIYEIYRSHGSTPISFARAIIAALKEAS